MNQTMCMGRILRRLDGGAKLKTIAQDYKYRPELLPKWLKAREKGACRECWVRRKNPTSYRRHKVPLCYNNGVEERNERWV